MTNCILPLILALLAGGAVFAVFAGLAGPRRRGLLRAQRETTLAGIQVRLDRAQLGIGAATYVGQSLAYGVAFGLLMAFSTGAWLAFFAGVPAGFAFAWARLEDHRNERLNGYNKALASVADTIVNSWRVRPSMNRALEMAATYGQGDVAADFADVRLALRAGRPLADALQIVADRRQSPVFDAFATALIVAEEASGEVTEMLVRQADATRRQAVIYEETLDEQKGSRQDALWGVVGPWGVMLLIRLATMFTGGLGYGTEFFATPLGQVAALFAGALTTVAYVSTHRTASRGLIVGRIGLERGKGDEATAGAPAPAPTSGL